MSSDIQNQYRDFNLQYKPDGTKGPAVVTGYMSIRESLLNILFTEKGSRFFNRRFGTMLHSLLFEPMNQSTMSKIRILLYMSIPDLEPRVEISPYDIDVVADYNSKLYLITLHAREKSTEQLFRLSAVLEQVT